MGHGLDDALTVPSVRQGGPHLFLVHCPNWGPLLGNDGSSSGQCLVDVVRSGAGCGLGPSTHRTDWAAWGRHKNAGLLVRQMVKVYGADMTRPRACQMGLQPARGVRGRAVDRLWSALNSAQAYPAITNIPRRIRNLRSKTIHRIHLAVELPRGCL